MASHYIKCPDVCIENECYGDKHDACASYGTLHAATCTCTHVQSKRNLQRPVTSELYMHRNLPKEYTFIYTMCAHCEGMFTYSAVRNKRPNSLQVVQN